MATLMKPDNEVRQLVNDNRTLVEWTVNRYLDRHAVSGAEREDLVSWGLLGLLSAARAFDPGRGLRFSTLATLAIERSIMRGAMQADNGKKQTLSLDEALSENGSGDGETRWVEMIRDEAAELGILVGDLSRPLLAGEHRDAAPLLLALDGTSGLALGLVRHEIDLGGRVRQHHPVERLRRAPRHTLRPQPPSTYDLILFTRDGPSSSPDALWHYTTA